MSQAITVIIEYLRQVGPSSVNEIAAATKLHRNHVYWALTHNSGVYIKEWTTINDRLAAIWAAGFKRSEPKPKPLTQSERERRWRLRNPEKYAIMKRKKAAADGCKPKTTQLGLGLLVGQLLKDSK